MSENWRSEPEGAIAQTGERSAPSEADRFPETADAEFISIPEWARRLGVSAESAYKAARSGQIPGCFAIGRLYRVNWTAFVECTRLAS